MKHKQVNRWEILKVEAEGLKKQRPTCPRCGEGIYIGVHKEKSGKIRQYCGKCHYTVWP